MKLGAAYIRVSTTDQLEYSPESQLRLIKEYAIKHNIVIYNEFIYKDEGVSGRDADKRPAFQSMISTAKQKDKPFDCILVYSTSRFARNHEQSIVYRSMLEKEHGIEVISITQPSIDRKTDMLTNAIYSIMDEWYSLDLSENVKRGMTQKALEGGHQTAPPYGYEKKQKGSEITIKEDEAEIIKFIFNEFLNNVSTWAISRKLRAREVKTKKGRYFDTRKITYILRNPVYKGYARWTPNKRVYWDFKNEDTIIRKSTHKPIISEETFEKVQNMLDEKEAKSLTRARPKESTKHWLSGLIKCSECGSSLIYSGSSPTRKNPNFRCGGYNKGYCKTQNSILLSEAEHLTLNYFNTICEDINILYDADISLNNNSKSEIEHIKHEVKNLKLRLERAKQGFLNGVLDINEFRIIKTNSEEEINKKEKAIKELSINKIRYGHLQKQISNVYAILKKPYFPKDEKQHAIRSIVKKIVFNKKQGEFKIYF